MPREELPTDIPSFGVTREEAVAAAPRGAIPGRASGGGGGIGAFGGFILLLSFLGASAACAGGYYFYLEFNESQAEAASLSGRVADLEALLSDTDESVEKSAAALGAQLNVVDKETRRLEQHRRKLTARIDKLEDGGTALQGRTDSLESASKSQGSTLTALSGDIDRLRKVAADLEQLDARARDAQSNMERMADATNRANLERAALNKRVAANEEWIESINAFRRQVNATLNRLESGGDGAPANPNDIELQ